MFRIDNTSAVATIPVAPPVGVPGFFTDGNPQVALEATVVDAWWANMLQEEILTVVTEAGLTPNKADNTQLWQALRLLTRVKVAGNPTVYVNHATGNDNNDGQTPATAFATIQRGVNQLVENIDLGPYTAFLSIAAGTYHEQIIVASPIVGQMGQGAFQWITTGGQVVINSAGYCITVQGGASLALNGNFLLTCSAATGQPNAALAPIAGSRLAVYGTQVNFGACPGCYHVYSAGGGEFNNASGNGSYTISGSANGHWYSAAGGRVTVNGVAVTLANTPAFNNFANAADGGAIDCQGLTFPGTGATGARYYATTNGVINTGSGGGLTYLPGNAIGGTSSGGQYV